MASKKAKGSSGSGLRIAGPLVKQEEGKNWFDHTYQEKAADDSDRLTGAALKELESEANVLLTRDVDLYNKMMRSSKEAEAQWLSTVVQKGTQADRTTAMLLQINRSPVHSLFYINSLVSIIEKKNLRQAVDIIKAVHELFGKSLLPTNRKLVPFANRPLARLTELSSGNDVAMEKRLILWKFESDLKRSYETLVRGLESLAGGNVEAICVQACRTLLDLLVERPEQEQFLLTSLVNRLGHPNAKIAAKVSLHLIELTRRQPNMRLTVVKETERLIYRKNVSEKAQMYAISFMSQIIIGGPEASTLAVTMLNIYFGLFKILVNLKRMDDRISNTLVVATGRAFPYAKEKAPELLSEIDSLYKLVHVSKYSTSLQTLKLIMQVLSASEGVSDRFYSALYGKLLEPHTAALETQMFTLVYKAIERDPVDERVRAFVKRLLQMALVNRPSYACATLLIVSKIQQSRNILKFTKAADTTLYVRDGEIRTDDASDDEEHYVDAPEPDTDEDDEMNGMQNGKKSKKNKKAKNGKKAEAEKEAQNVSGWMHRPAKKDNEKHGVTNAYNPSARNPLFANANQMVDTELVMLTSHYHPSVRVFAQNLLDGTPVVYKGDPFHDFSMLRFLERFVFKNPKTKKDDEKAKKVHRLGIKYKKYEPEGVRGLAIQSEEFVNKKRQQIPVDELYLHRFATLKLKKEDKQDEYESDHESVNSDEFDVLLNKFEPGEANEEFDVDFGKEFSIEQTGRKKAQKRAKDDEDDSDMGSDDDDDVDDDVDDEEFDYEDGDDDANDDEDEDADEDDDEDGDEDEDEDMDEDGEAGFAGADSDLDDDDEDDYADNIGYAEDAAISADRLQEMMEREEEMENSKGKKMKKTWKAKGKKKARF